MLDKNHDVTVTRGALEIGAIPDAVRRAARRDGVLHVSVNGRLQSIPVDRVLKAKKRYAESGFLTERKRRRKAAEQSP
jgi:hypothetical protein